MTARLVLVCDVCGAVTDDHYAHPVADARFRARATGWTRRRHIRKNGDRLFVDLCPEHTYDLGFVQEPVMHAPWKRPRPVQPSDPQPLTERTLGKRLRYETDVVIHHDGDGPYRLYAQLARTLRAAGADRGTIEQIRREMFAPGADWLRTAAMWANIKTEEDDAEVHDEEAEGSPSEPGG